MASSEMAPKKVPCPWWKHEIASAVMDRVIAVLKSIAAVLVIIVAIVTGPMLWHWYPVLGRSMEPTLPRIGGYYKAEKPIDQGLKVNDIVVLRGATLGYVVKRVAKVDQTRGIYVLGDNTDESMDSSFGADKNNPNKDVWIPFCEVKGKVFAVWSPQRAWRSRTAEGRFENWLQFHYPPRQIMLRKGRWTVVETSNEVKLFRDSAQVAKIRGWRFLSLKGQKLSCYNPNLAARLDLDLVTLRKRVVTAPDLKLPTRTQAVTCTSRNGMITTLFLPYKLPPLVSISWGRGEKRKVRIILLPEIPQLKGKPGSMVVLLPPLVGINTKTIEVKLE